MKKIVVALLGMSLVACSNSPQTLEHLNGSQSTALSGAESVVTPIDSGAAAGGGGSGGGSSAAGSGSSAPKSEAAAQTAAATSGKTGSSNGGRTSLYWFVGSLAAIGGVILATDAITGGEAIGLFGEKKSPQQQEKSEAIPTTTSSQKVVTPSAEDCTSQAPGSTASSTIQSAQDVVQFAESPKNSR